MPARTPRSGGGAWWGMVGSELPVPRPRDQHAGDHRDKLPRMPNHVRERLAHDPQSRRPSQRLADAPQPLFRREERVAGPVDDLQQPEETAGAALQLPIGGIESPEAPDQQGVVEVVGEGAERKRARKQSLRVRAAGEMGRRIDHPPDARLRVDRPVEDAKHPRVDFLRLASRGV